MWPLLLLAAIGFDLRDAQGRRHTLEEARESRAVVVVFTAPDCPLPVRYGPECGGCTGSLRVEGWRSTWLAPKMGSTPSLPC